MNNFLELFFFYHPVEYIILCNVYTTIFPLHTKLSMGYSNHIKGRDSNNIASPALYNTFFKVLGLLFGQISKELNLSVYKF